ncbi:hypothetical protein THTE_1650 [Thermogutta terrifontis]|uniref:Uncharacterized protein n=1 Tax=Thermogutta terrifontis TaxID=1331910 RepID=A0A286RE77_9BACT|nr:hypothetical protein THTE_1650 [Thermogutta terrifontis]
MNLSKYLSAWGLREKNSRFESWPLIFREKCPRGERESLAPAPAIKRTALYCVMSR